MKNKKGFSLLEIIIYLGILGMIVISFISFSLAVSNLENKIYVAQTVNYNMRNALELISQKIREAEDVVLPASGDSNSELRLTRTDGNPDWIFSLAGGIIYLGTDFSTPVEITSNEVEITSLTFTNLSKKHNRDTIKVSIEALYRGAASSEFKYENNLETTITTRK